MFYLASVFRNLLLIFACIMIVSGNSYTCVHDEVSFQQRYELGFNKKKERIKRHADESIYEPLNIHIHRHNMENRLSNDVLYNINYALLKALKLISETMEVKQVENPFLIQRTSCSQKWRFGSNKGRCSRTKSTPEFCSLKDTDFVIPDQYLNRLEVYDSQSSKPVRVIADGPGLNNSNFILFVISELTSWCKKSEVQAYGSFCRLDQTNRPIAGLLNFCPEIFSKKLYKPAHYFNIIVHELFHILGFSKHLYSKFKTCISNYECETPKSIISKDKNGIQRLLFPDVVYNMQKHFNCSSKDFGGPLENITYSTSELSSHWHPLLMYSSIMTPSIQQDDYVVIDNISLALLASTGWYKINFSKAQPFLFGKGEGCDFGFGDNCIKSKFLCNSSNQTGCDVSLRTIGKCQKVAPHHPCGVYKPDKDESCVEEEEKLYGLQSSLFDKQCIIVHQKNDEISLPACVALNFRMSTSLNLHVNGSWGDNDLMEATNKNISTDCPRNISLCFIKGIERPITLCNLNGDKFAIFIQMFFSSPSSSDIFDLDKFEIKTLQGIASQLNIPFNYIVNSSLHISKSMHLDFIICPPPELDVSELESLIARVQDFVKKSSFINIFKEHKTMPVASNDISVNPNSSLTFSDYEGLHALIIVPVICGIFILATFFASLIRLLIFKRHRPKRNTVEVQELCDISHGS